MAGTKIGCTVTFGIGHHRLREHGNCIKYIFRFDRYHTDDKTIYKGIFYYSFALLLTNAIFFFIKKKTQVHFVSARECRLRRKDKQAFWNVSCFEHSGFIVSAI